MKSITNFFKRMDEVVFKQVDDLKNMQGFQIALSKLEILSDVQQKIINQGLSYLIILSPAIFLLMVLFSNSSIRNEIEIKTEIFDNIRTYQERKAEISNVSGRIVSPYVLDSKTNLIRRVGSMGIAGLQVENFETSEVSGDLLRTTATLKFQGISTKSLTSFMNGLLNEQKMKISRLDVTKNNSNSTLKGEMDIIHFGKIPAKK